MDYEIADFGIEKTPKNDAKKRQSRECSRLKKLLKASGAEDWKIKALQPVIINTAWMCVKLEDTVEQIGDASVTVEYDNGGGQSGIRQNPIFQGYESLWKAYMTGMSQILTAADAKKDSRSDKLKPKSVIAMVRAQAQAQ